MRAADTSRLARQPSSGHVDFASPPVGRGIGGSFASGKYQGGVMSKELAIGIVLAVFIAALIGSFFGPQRTLTRFHAI